MSSSGIRSFELARALSREVDVTLMAPHEPSGLELPFAVRPWTTDIEALNDYDAVLAQALPPALMRALARSTVNFVLDLYIPGVVEARAAAAANPSWRARARARAAGALHELALVSANAFVCASERQRDALVDELAAVGRVPGGRDAVERADELIAVVPFGLPEAPPAGPPALLPGVEPGDIVFLWAGGISAWFDPLTPIRAVAELAPVRAVKLVFMALAPPVGTPTAAAREAYELAHSLGVLERSVIFLDGWVPYAERQHFLLAGDVGVSAHKAGPEAQYAFRTRLLDHFWALLPTITSRGDVLGDLVEREELGIALAPGDVTGWVNAIRTAADDDDWRARVRANVERVRPRFEWPRVVEPLQRLVSRRGRAVSAPAVFERAATVATNAEVALTLRAHRATRRVRRLWW
jgi:glycosyltransferase involved in cell wall biosynthesis